jgi:hypothetical protein
MYKTHLCLITKMSNKLVERVGALCYRMPLSLKHQKFLGGITTASEIQWWLRYCQDVYHDVERPRKLEHVERKFPPLIVQFLFDKPREEDDLLYSAIFIKYLQAAIVDTFEVNTHGDWRECYCASLIREGVEFRFQFPYLLTTLDNIQVFYEHLQNIMSKDISQHLNTHLYEEGVPLYDGRYDEVNFVGYLGPDFDVNDEDESWVLDENQIFHPRNHSLTHNPDGFLNEKVLAVLEPYTGKEEFLYPFYLSLGYGAGNVKLRSESSPLGPPVYHRGSKGAKRTIETFGQCIAFNTLPLGGVRTSVRCSSPADHVSCDSPRCGAVKTLGYQPPVDDGDILGTMYLDDWNGLVSGGTYLHELEEVFVRSAFCIVDTHKSVVWVRARDYRDLTSNWYPMSDKDFNGLSKKGFKWSEPHPNNPEKEKWFKKTLKDMILDKWSDDTFVKKGMVFFPYNKYDRRHRDQKDSRVFNLFRGWKTWETAKGLMLDPSKVERVLEHIRAMCGYHEEAYEYALKWLAFTIQDPGRLVKSMWVLKGPQQCGKTSFFEWFGNYVLGPDYYVCTNPTSSLLKSRFNAPLIGKKLYVMNEQAERGEALSHSETLKSMITDEEQLFERKFADPVKEKNFISLVCTTNNEGNFKVPDSKEQRTFATEMDGQFVGNKEYFDALYSDPEETAAHFYLYLMDIDISGWKPGEIPMTPLHERLIGSSKSNLQQFLEEIIEEDPPRFLYTNQSGQDFFRVFSITFYEQFEEWCKGHGIRESYVGSQKNLSVKMASYFGSAKNIRIDGNLKKGWKLPYENAIATIHKYS